MQITIKHYRFYGIFQLRGKSSGYFKRGVAVRPIQIYKQLAYQQMTLWWYCNICSKLEISQFLLTIDAANGISHQPECSEWIIPADIADDTSVEDDVIDLTSRLYNEQSTDTNVFHCPDKGQSRLIRVTTVIIFSYTIPALSLSPSLAPPPPHAQLYLSSCNRQGTFSSPSLSSVSVYIAALLQRIITVYCYARKCQSQTLSLGNLLLCRLHISYLQQSILVFTFDGSFRLWLG